MIYIHLIIFLIFIFFLINNNQILKEELDSIISKNSPLKIRILFYIICIIIYLIIKKIPKKNKTYYITIIILLLLIIIEIKLLPKYKIDNIIHLKKIYNNLNTGDLVLFRSYNSYDLPDFVIFRLITSLLSDNYFSHIGIIVKINNKPYIMECSQEILFCSYSKKLKNGSVLIEPYKRIKEYYGDIYIVKNNLHKYINDNDNILFFEKYKKCKYLEDLLICTTFINKFLYKNNITNKNKKIILPSEFLNKNFYKINYQMYNLYKII